MAPSIYTPEVDDRIQLIFENFWRMNKSTPPVHWRSLYRTERIYNVYGIAAASALAYFQTEIYMKSMLQLAARKNLPPGHIPGRTHPLLLKYMVLPVIAQGRWAIQSSISVRNAHPFVDEKKQRAVVLNGQFNSETESRVKQFLTQVCGIILRSENSTELFSTLWGYYFETAFMANQRYKVIERQHQQELEDISICSQSVDYGIYKSLSNKTKYEVDEMSFIRAMEVMIKAGGQFAVSGISLVSPDRLFIAVHKRPLYIVKRRDTSDFMVVSDINAALGLFPQSLIQSASIKLRKLMNEYSKKSVIVEPGFFSNRSEDSRDAWFRKEKMALLESFRVDIYALDQERIFARILTKAGMDNVLRELEIRDFTGKIRTDIQPESTFLTPITFKKDFGKTFYEEHLLEIPGLLNDLLDRYTCPKRNIPDFDIRKRLLVRRFGQRLSNLSRIILVSTGFSFELAQIAEKTMEQFFKGINIVVTTPLDIDNIESSINPDRDLVIMISWSGTTSDMIDFASYLLNQNILMVGITEKPFSDLGLIVRKSVGIIPVLSGEEATVAATKSAVCMLLVLDLFCLFIQMETSEKEETASRLIEEMKKLPQKISGMLASKKVINFCRNTSTDAQHSVRHYIVDTIHNIGSGKLGALNFELNAWVSMGSAIDYSEQEAFFDIPIEKSSLVLVNATSSSQLLQGVEFMEKLHLSGQPFFAVSYRNREKKEIEKYAENVVFLPKMPDYFQPFVDITFMFLFGFYFGLAKGRLSDEMPRNMAKSVTAGRLKDSIGQSATDVLDDLAVKNQVLPDISKTLLQQDVSLPWIESAVEENEKQYYSDLLRLCAVFHEQEPFSAIFSSQPDDRMLSLSNLIFKYLDEDGIIIFVPMDKHAESGCRNFVRLWGPLFNIPLQVEHPEKIKGVSTEDSLVVVVASEPADKGLLSDVSGHSHENLLWIGPENNNGISKPFSEAFGSYYLKTTDFSCPNDYIYVAMCQFFSTVMAYKFPHRTQLLSEHFKLFLPTVSSVLSDNALRASIQKAILENQAYKKVLFITSFKGNCISWEYKFRTHKRRALESETFGVSTYSHLVLVDPNVNAKYVRIEPRQVMEKMYTEQEIKKWETRYLGGSSVDEFLHEFSMPYQQDSVLPFMIDDQWYLPVLKDDYKTEQDCLIIIDATSEKHFDAVLDELATFGSRYARLVIITQEGFYQDARLANLKKYPLSHIVMLPAIKDGAGNACVVSDYILPVVVNIIGSALKFLDL